MIQKGDILIVNSGFIKQLVGHAAIAINNKEIMHIKGPFKKLEIITYEEFFKLYLSKKHQYIKVYHLNNDDNNIINKMLKHLIFLYINYKNQIKYRFNFNLSNELHTYCSKLIIQAYYKTTYQTKQYQFIWPKQLPDLLNLELKEQYFYKNKRIHNEQFDVIYKYQ